VIGMDHEQDRRARDIGNHRHRHVVEPDVFAKRRPARAVGLGDEVAIEVVDVLDGA
jgi:hypothetical protein